MESKVVGQKRVRDDSESSQEEQEELQEV
jgi:cell division cycle 2-like